MGNETEAIERAVSLSEIRSGVNRNDQRLSELHTRVSRIDDQLDRIENEIGRVAAVMEARDKRAAQVVKARASHIDKVFGLLKNPALWAAVGAGGISLGGNQLCNASQAHNPQPGSSVLVAPLIEAQPQPAQPQPATLPPDTGP